MTKYSLFTALTVLVAVQFAMISHAQEDDLFDLLEAGAEQETDFVTATFKSTRLISGHSAETNASGVLQFLIGHRFGRLNSGWRDLFGLDNATIRLGLDYGITDNLNVGIGRASFQKTFDGFVKWRFLRQGTGKGAFPITATYVGSAFMLANEWQHTERDNLFSSRMSYYHGLLIARKFGDAISLQLSPAVIHRNLVPTANDQNTLYAIGGGFSLRVTGSLRFNAEYHYLPSNQVVSNIGGEPVRNSLSLGVDIETGGHVFQLHFTNSRGMTEQYLISETTGNWADGGVHFGFNVSRVFTVRRPPEFR